MTGLSNSPSLSIRNNGSSGNMSKDLNIIYLVIIMLVYILIAFVLAPMIGFFINKKKGLIIGYAVGLVIILLLWLIFGRFLI